jgi:hypothetical protein
MSGESVAYHLRLNKFIERELFFELLSRLKPGVPRQDLSRYCYASMGGKFMEDLKIANHRLGIRNLFCIESDKTTFGRQLFNKPLSWIQCLQKSSEDFINDFGNLCENRQYPNFIVWLDYAAANKRGSQLTEFQSLVAQMSDFDIVKITLNADVKTLMGRPLQPAETDEGTGVDVLDKIREEAFQRLSNQLGAMMPAGFDGLQMRQDALPYLLLEAVRIVAVKGMSGRPRSRIVPLAINRYSDGHQMLTVTAMILPVVGEHDFFERTKIKEWDFFSPDWTTIHKIHVPDLSLREKLEIDQKLGRNPTAKIHRDLPFKLHKNREASLEILQNYAVHYERYPSFGRYTT